MKPPAATDGAAALPSLTHLRAVSDPGLRSAWPQRVTRGAAVLTMLVGCLVMVGWALHVRPLGSLVSPVAMTQVSGLCFLLSGVALLGRQRANAAGLTRRLADVAALLALTIGTSRLLGYLADWSTGPDNLLFGGALGAYHMPPNSSLNFVLVGAALLTLDRTTKRGHWPPFYLVLGAFCVALVALTGYFYHTLTLYRLTHFTPMSLHTALLFMALCAGIVCARPHHDPLETLTSASAGGRLARRLLPLGLLVPLGLGWLRLAGQSRGLYDTELGAALLVLLSSALFTGMIWWNARSVHQVEAVQRQAERHLLDKNRALSHAVEEARAAHEAALAAHEALKQTQAHLVQNEKLASLGQMVAGVAHEINNPLAFVSNNTAVLQRDAAALGALLALYQQADDLIRAGRPALAAEIAEQAEAVDLAYTLENLDGLCARSREGLRRIQQIVKDLRDFARLDENERHEVNLSDGVTSTVNIISGLARRREVTIETALAPLPALSCHPAKLNQVVMNLLSNALDASEKGSTIQVRTFVLEPSGDLCIEVRDHGPGVPPEIRARIFDPFFTTKPPGHGTGLGLSISYGIVRDHGGEITVTSPPEGGGACFQVRLPRQAAG